MSIFSTDSRTTLAKIKTYHEVAGTDKDTLITQVIELAADRIIRYCNRDFESKARVETPLVEGHTDRFHVGENPVASITSIVEDGVTLTENTDYFVEKETGAIIKISDQGRINRIFWNTIPNKITASYTGGLALPDGVVWVFLELVGVIAGLKERAFVDNEGVENVVTVNSLPKKFLDILDQYRKANLC